MSLPSRERGLKYKTYIASLAPNASLPSRERGLKYKELSANGMGSRRSPRGSVD